MAAVIAWDRCSNEAVLQIADQHPRDHDVCGELERNPLTLR
jgi:hypothetical protein